MATSAISIADPTPDKPPRRRRWIPVSLWIFVVVQIILAGGGALWFAVRESRQNTAIAEIERLGGKVERQTRDFVRLPDFLGGKRLIDMTVVKTVHVNRPSDANAISPFFGRFSPAPLLYVRDTPIHRAAEHGETERVVELLRECPLLICARDRMEQTPLHIASHSRHIELVRLLLERGAEVDARAYNEFTPLRLARDPAIADLLARNGADLNAVDAYGGGTALQHASSNVAHFSHFPRLAEDCEVERRLCALLLQRGAEYDICSAVCLDDLNRVRILVKDSRHAQNKRAMLLACEYGREAIVRVFLDHGAHPEDADYGGLTLSYVAIEHPRILKMLFDAGADPAVSVNYVGDGLGPRDSTLLHEAADKGAADSVRLLLGYGLSVNAQNEAEQTPLHLAAFGGHDVLNREACGRYDLVVELLLAHKADLTIRNFRGMTPLDVAADRIQYDERDDEKAAQQKAVVQRLHDAIHAPELFAEIALGYAESVEKLLREFPELANLKDSFDKPPLQRAISLDQRRIVCVLLAAGADANGCDDRRATALHTAALWGREELTHTLLAHGADPNLTDQSACTPLHESIRAKTWGVAKILIDAGADTRLETFERRTALDMLRRDQARRAKADNDRQDPQVAEIIQLLSRNVDPAIPAEPVGEFDSLDLSGQDLRNEDLSRLDGIVALEWLAINRNPISDEGLRHVALLKSLRALRVEHTQIADGGLVHLEGLKRLEVLSLKGTYITDAGIERLLRLSRLRFLDLSQTAVSDVGLKQLRALPHLTELRVDRTRVTKKGLAELQQALPGLKPN